jgi:putative transposase
MDMHVCLEALDQALRQGQQEIFTTDQRAQCTSQAFTARLKKGGVKISMDGRGRAMDNVFEVGEQRKGVTKFLKAVSIYYAEKFG